VAQREGVINPKKKEGLKNTGKTDKLSESCEDNLPGPWPNDFATTGTEKHFFFTWVLFGNWRSKIIGQFCSLN